jgi:hypothetical protein
MKRILGSVALFALFAFAAFVPQASAQCVTGTGVNILLKWDANGFSYETGAPYTNYTSPAGNVLTNVLGVSLFCNPLAGLNPNDPAKEYTMVWTGLVSGGTVSAPFGSSGVKRTTLYTGGSFALYEGPVNARAWTSGTVPLPGVALPAYTDGSVVLSGAIDSLTTVVTTSSAGSTNGSFRGRYRFTGGPLAALFCAGHTVSDLFDGLWFPVAPPAGYTGHNNGKFDGPDCTTPTAPATWGRLKTLYR